MDLSQNCPGPDRPGFCDSDLLFQFKNNLDVVDMETTVFDYHNVLF